MLGVMPVYDMQWHAAHSIEPEDITATCDESTTHAENSSESIIRSCRKIISSNEQLAANQRQRQPPATKTPGSVKRR